MPAKMVDSLVDNIPIKMETYDDVEATNKQMHCSRYPKRRKHKNAETSYSSGVDNKPDLLTSDVEQGKTEELFHNEIKVEPKLEAIEDFLIITELEEEPKHYVNMSQPHPEEDSKVYQCEKCIKNFRRHVDLREHKRSHRGEKLFKCEICDRAFTSKSYVWPHMQKQHKAAIAAISKAQRERYMEIKPKSSNSELVGSSASKRKSTIQRHRFGTNNFQCNVCPKTFARNSDLKIHSRIHTGEKPYTCDICQKNFRANANLNFHKKAHMGEKYKKYKCDHCDKRFIRKIDLKVHMCTHTGERPFKCKICNYGYSSKVNLKAHMQRDHGMNLNGEELPQSDGSNTVKVLTKNKKRLRSELRHKLKRKINCNDEYILPTDHEYINASYSDGDTREQNNCLSKKSTIKLVALAESADTNTPPIKEEKVDTYDESMNSFVPPATSIVKEEIMISSYYMPEG